MEFKILTESASIDEVAEAFGGWEKFYDTIDTVMEDYDFWTLEDLVDFVYDYYIEDTDITYDDLYGLIEYANGSAEWIVEEDDYDEDADLDEDLSKSKKCVICKKPYSGYGNNAEPLAKGRCCDACNMKVIKARLGSLEEDTVKTSKGKWVNKGEEGTHGEFKTKKEADAQRKAMFARGYKTESKKLNLDEALGLDNFKEKLETIKDSKEKVKVQQEIDSLRKEAEEAEDRNNYYAANKLTKEADKLQENFSETQALVNELSNYLLKQDMTYDVYNDGDKIIVRVEYGDWKHDHIALDLAVADFFDRHSKYKGKVVEVEEEDSDSDTYTANHIIEYYPYEVGYRVPRDSDLTEDAEHNNDTEVDEFISNQEIDNDGYNKIAYSIDMQINEISSIEDCDEAEYTVETAHEDGYISDEEYNDFMERIDSYRSEYGTDELNESKGFLRKYKGCSIHDTGDVFTITNKHGKTIGSSKTEIGAEAIIDDYISKDSNKN